MRMTRLEKLFVNRTAKGAANLARVRAQLEALGLAGPQDTLELGCGAGDVAAALARDLGHRAIGADLDPAQIALARDRHAGVRHVAFAVGDAGALDVAAERFDLVVAQNVFHHAPAWRDVVAEIGRVLKPGGHVLWLDLTLPPLLARILAPLRRRVGVYTLDDVLRAFREHGVDPVTVRPLTRWPALRHELSARKRAA